MRGVQTALFAFVSQGAHHFDDRTADALIGDLYEGLVQLQTFASCEEVYEVVFRLGLGKAAPWRATQVVRGCVLVKEVDRHTKHVCEVEQASSTYSVHAFFVLLNLLEGQTKIFAQLFLTHAQNHPPQANTPADMDVYCVRSSRIALFSFFVRSLYVLRHSTPGPNLRCIVDDYEVNTSNR